MSTYKKLDVAEILIDHRYQRPLDEKRIEKMAGDFNPALFGVLEVSVRNGKVAVFDGQHRLEAARVAGIDKVACLVHKLTPKEEAEMFVQLQRERKGIHPVDQFRAHLFAGDEECVAIAKIVEVTGFKISARSGAEAGQQRCIGAVKTLHRVHRMGLLTDTMKTIGQIWGGDYKSTDGKLIEGMAMLLDGYGHRLGDEELARLRDVAPVDVIRRAVGRRRAMSGNPTAQSKAVFEELRFICGLRGAPKKTTSKP